MIRNQLKTVIQSVHNISRLEDDAEIEVESSQGNGNSFALDVDVEINAPPI